MKKTPDQSPVPDGVDEVAWAEWDEYRRKHKALAWTRVAKTKAGNILRGLATEDQRATVDAAIQSGWTGLFPRKGKTASTIRPEKPGGFLSGLRSKERAIDGECEVTERARP